MRSRARRCTIARMNATTAELYRLLHNLIRIGTIAEVDHAVAQARVQIGPLLTDWRPWGAQRAGNAQTWWAPSIGEQVLFFSPGGDMTSGIIMSALYSTAHPAPSDNQTLDMTVYPDGAIIQYDHATHALSATLPEGSSATITATAITAIADIVTADAPTTICTGDLRVAGNITAQANITVAGTLAATGDVTGAGISLSGHKHGGIQPGGGQSGGPQ